jgi:hypothetical protein
MSGYWLYYYFQGWCQNVLLKRKQTSELNPEDRDGISFGILGFRLQDYTVSQTIKTKNLYFIIDCEEDSVLKPELPVGPRLSRWHLKNAVFWDVTPCKHKSHKA